MSEEPKSDVGRRLAEARAAKRAERLAAGATEAVAEAKAEVSASDALLTDEEVAEVRAQARADAIAKVNKEKRKALLLKIAQEEEALVKAEMGQLSGEPQMDEIVSCPIELPEWSPDIKLNGMRYQAGVTYPVPRHVANTLMEIMQANRNLEHNLSGKKKSEYYRAAKPILVTPTGALPGSVEMVGVH